MVTDRFKSFGTTIFTEMTLLANTHVAVNLAQGFPDFDGPAFIHEAAMQAMRDGRNQYARMFGLPVLNEAIAAWWLRNSSHEHAIDPEREITVTSGCTEAIAAAMLGLINPGDEVILFEPYYDSYRACVAMAGATPRFVSLRPGTDGFSFDDAELAAAFTTRTRAILVNSPHNPTGKVFTRDELARIASLCVKHGVIALVDEVYERLTYRVDRPHMRLANFPGMRERTVTMSSLGKTFSLTGWKIGWAVAAPPLTAGIRSAHQFLTFATSTPLQVGAAVALGSGTSGGDPVARSEAAVMELVGDLARSREFLAAALRDLGFDVTMPDGAYFIMAGWRNSEPAARLRARLGSIDGDVAFCRGLTEHARVAAIPPSVFYEHRDLGSGMARFAFCKKQATLDEAVRRLSAFARGEGDPGV